MFALFSGYKPLIDNEVNSALSYFCTEMGIKRAHYLKKDGYLIVCLDYNNLAEGDIRHRSNYEITVQKLINVTHNYKGLMIFTTDNAPAIPTKVLNKTGYICLS